MSMTTFLEWKIMNEVVKKSKILCIIMRGLPGSGKSTTVKSLLTKHGGTHEGHVFSADRFFHPKSNHLSVLDIDSLSVEKSIAEATEILNLWYKSKYAEIKKQEESAFLDFKKLYDTGDYKGALHVAKNMHPTLEKIEYMDRWSPTVIGYAHKQNLEKFKVAIDTGISPVIVDNTNVKIKEMKAFVEYAHEAGYEIKIQEPESPHWSQYRQYLGDQKTNKAKIKEFAGVLAAKNSHGVPQETIENMLNKWQHNVTVNDILRDKDSK